MEKVGQGRLNQSAGMIGVLFKGDPGPLEALLGRLHIGQGNGLGREQLIIGALGHGPPDDDE